MKIIIDGELADLNTFINEQRKNKYGGAAMKKANTAKCAAAFTPIRARKLKLPITIHVTWVCKDKRKDKDNIAFAKKFLLDGMIQCGLLKNDGWSEIAGFTDSFEIDKENPRIEVELEESK
ncbi:RusA family crossover junction endodeoxyribonuclease [Enterococcus sp. LJL120]